MQGATVHIAYVLSGPFSPGDGGEGVTRGAAGQLRPGCANREGFVVQLLYPRPENIHRGDGYTVKKG